MSGSSTAEVQITAAWGCTASTKLRLEAVLHIRRAKQPGGQQLRFLLQLHIAGEQQHAVRRLHGEHQGVVVLILGIPGERPQHGERCFIGQRQPVPRAQPGHSLPPQGGCRLHGVPVLGNIIIDGRCVPGVHGDAAFRQLRQAAVMILIAMGEEHAVQARDPVLPQRFPQGPVGAIIPRVDQVGLIRKQKQQAVRLADVQGDQPYARPFRPGITGGAAKQNRHQQYRQQSAHAHSFFHLDSFAPGVIK